MEGQIIGNCQGENAYTGISDCSKAEGRTESIIITGLNALYPVEQELFKAGLDGYVLTDGPLKMMPVKGIMANTPSGGEISTNEIGFAGAMPVGISGYSEVYQVDAGDCFYKELAKLNKRKVRVFRVDSDGFIYGTIVIKNGVKYFTGFQATVYALRTKGTDNTTAAAITIAAYYSASYEKELKNLNAFEVGEVPDGLLGVILQKGGAAGTAKVIGSCGGEDYTSTFGDDWTQGMFLNESGANPTSVTYNEATGMLTFVPVGSYRVASASVLSAGDVTGLAGVETFVNLNNPTT